MPILLRHFLYLGGALLISIVPPLAKYVIELLKTHNRKSDWPKAQAIKGVPYEPMNPYDFKFWACYTVWVVVVITTVFICVL